MPSVLSNTSIGSTLMKSASDNARINFNIQFRQIERTTIERLNTDIEKVVQKYSHEDELRQMQKEYDRLQADIPLYKEYRFVNEGNLTRFQDLGDTVSSTISVFDTAAGTLSADQATQINELYQDILDQMKGLYPAHHPDLNGGNFVFQFKGLVEDIEGLTATAGVVDDEGTSPATNDNREIYDTLQDLLTRADAAKLVTANTVNLTTELIIDTQTELYALEAKQAEYQIADVEKVKFEVGNLKEKYSHLLQAISLSFEVSQGYSNYLSEQIEGKKVAPGSVMNLFA